MPVVPLRWLKHVPVTVLAVLARPLVYDNRLLVLLLLDLLKFLIGVTLILLILLFVFIVLTLGQVLPN